MHHQSCSLLSYFCAPASDRRPDAGATNSSEFKGVPVMRVLLISICLLATTGLAQTNTPLLLRKPTVSKTQIVFNYGGDLWIAARDGGDARRLTAGMGNETDPLFSPDGTMIAFTGDYDGNKDVYVVPSAGGAPKRLTYHPGADEVVGWTPDGKRILFRSGRFSYYHSADKLFTVAVEGGFPTELPLPIGEEGSWSPDGSHLAYVPHPQWQKAWKRYRGGQTTPIWIADLKDSSVVKIPRENSNDFNPMWMGNTIYFLSDRNGPVSLFAYDTATKQVSEAVKSNGLDFKSASSGPDAIVIEQFGALHLYDLNTHQTKAINIRVAGDYAQVRPRFVKVEPKRIHNFNLSPTGSRALMEAWGEIFTVPTDKGDIRNVTHSPAVVDRDPAWSPDGKWIAYAKQLPSHLHTIFVYSLEKGKSFQVTDGMSDALYPVFDKNGKYLYFAASTDLGLAVSGGWDMSSDNRLITRSAYIVVLAKDLPSPLAPESDEEKVKEEIKAAEKEKEKSKDKTKDKDNKTDADKSTDKEESDKDKPKDDKSKDKDKDKDKDKESEKPIVVRIDIEDIGQRILALPIPARDYVNLVAGKSGILFLSEAPEVITEEDSQNLKQTLQKFDLSKRKVDKFLEDVNDFAISFNGEKLLYRKDEQWATTGTEEPPSSTDKPKPGEGPLKLEAMEVYLEPRAMWKQIYRETWRIERDFFYDPHYHGLDLAAAAKKYEPYLDGIASREELTYLFEEALGEITVGHMFVGGGYQPESKKVKGGLLGADYTLENGRYRVARVYNGENWNPGLQAPLTQPGVNVKAGEYILAVNGRELRASDDIYSFFEQTAGKQVQLKVGPNPDDKGAREITVVPVESEDTLRNLAWIEGNRRKVYEMTGGKVAYVHVPNTAGAGYSNFNRYYFAQVGKEAAVIDERFNEGGQLADYIIDCMRRPLLSRIVTREGADWSSPTAAIYGPKVMIINEMAGF